MGYGRGMGSLVTFTQREPLTEQEALDYVQRLAITRLLSTTR